MKSILTVLFLVLGSFVLNAQTSTESSETPLEGVWQLCIPTGDLKRDPQTGVIELDTTKLQPAYFYKVFGNTGELTAMFITPVLSLITISGTYEIVSSNQYIEHVNYHSNPDFANRDVVLDYIFISDGYLQSSYKNDMGMVGLEIWKKLKQGNPSVELKKLKDAGIIN
ncbi:DUF4488 domain-containing protein [Proteiniphilum sp.]|uniref:DUF4488 domain-containing protein n=1 Tax=Proteiniphilum sp. TaxID=1926877 RepID=UPI002B1FD150|nr:DUF4488 domain-containing protein [Proteiniphilum sp.]MEA4917757.1 DUF4488 domain-containing protein [Proteiniphilum sp.]